MSKIKESLGFNLEDLLRLAEGESPGEFFFEKRGAEAQELFQRGLQYLKKGDFLLAAANLLAATILEPEDPKAWNNLAVAYFSLGRPEEARRALKRVLQIDPENQIARENLALLKEAEDRAQR
ncbi:tetratricopeptide repeat protein [Thermosulfuriphilus sp.]